MLHRKRFGRNYAYEGTEAAKALGIRAMWGGNDTPAPVYNITQPATPAAPTATQTAEDYAKALPIYYQTAMQYQPQIAALEKSTNEQLYPNTAGLQETIAGQAKEALAQDVPEWYKTNVADTLKSQMGRNLVYNPQAQEDYGIATQQANQEYGNYWRNLALSAAGRQPLAASPNLMSTYTPVAQMANTATNYGNYSNAYSSMYGSAVGANANMYGNYVNNASSNPWMNMAGTIGGGLAGGFTGGWANNLFK